MTRPTPSQRLLARLKAMGVPIEDGAIITRTHAGYWQRRQGAWSWRVEQPNYRLPQQIVGSHHPVTDLVRAPRLVATWDSVTSDCSIDPYTEGTDYAARYGLTPLVEPDPTVAMRNGAQASASIVQGDRADVPKWQAAGMDRERDNIMSAARRQRLTPNSLTGWNSKHTVEIELVERQSKPPRSLYTVYLNGAHVGWVSGYAKYGRNGAGWAYTVGKDRAQFGFHAGESRRAMVEMVIEHALRDAPR